MTKCDEAKTCNPTTLSQATCIIKTKLTVYVLGYTVTNIDKQVRESRSSTPVRREAPETSARLTGARTGRSILDGSREY